MPELSSGTLVFHPSGKKSQAVRSDTPGMPGVSGDAKVLAPSTPGAMVGGKAKLPGVVPAFVLEGLFPIGGNT
jgi:hypothetical protein